MRVMMAGIFAAMLLAVAPGAMAQTQAQAQSSIVEKITAACSTEIENYCSQVKQGQGRMLACFYAHEDKLSVGCINALYDGMQQLERTVEAISYVAAQCRTDIDTLCASTVPGGGRIAKCLLDNKAELSEPCTQAVDETGLQVNE